jgi:uncharacterized protein YndB with AHSA1/START domain
MADAIQQVVTLAGTPAQVYRALMSSKGHAAFTKAPAEVSAKVGGTVSAYGDYILAINLALQPGKLIVQAWRASDWPAEAWSIATFRLAAARGGRTKLTFTQVGVPKKAMKGIAQGWHDFYWQPLDAYLGKRA